MNETIYDQIRGFVQLNANEIVVNDAGNGYLRHLDRTTGKTSTFAGLCNRFDRTHKDGTFSAARFSNIKFNIIRHHKRNSLFVLDGNNVIKELDLATKMVSSFLNIDSAGKLLPAYKGTASQNKHCDQSHHPSDTRY